MFWPLRPVDGITKPPPGAVIDLTHAMAPYQCYLFNEGAGTLYYDSAQQIQAGTAAVNGGAAWTGAIPGGYGPALTFNGVNKSFTPVFATAGGVIQVPRRIRCVADGNRPFSLAFHCRLTTGVQQGLYLELSSTDASSLLSVIGSTTGGVFFQLRNSAATLQQVNTGAGSLEDGRWHSLHCVSSGDGGQMLVYNNGARFGGATNNTLGTTILTDKSTFGSNQSNLLTGDIGYFMTWTRALSPDEVRAHAANPFQMFLNQRPLQPTLLPPTTVIDRRTGNFRAASRTARGSL